MSSLWVGGSNFDAKRNIISTWNGIGGGDPEWVLAGIGAGLVAVSIPFMSGYNKRAKNAAGLYNEAVMNTTSSFQPDVRFSVKANGVRLVITF